MMQRILWLITLLVVCFCCFCVSEDETLVKMYEKCQGVFPFDGMHLYYFDYTNGFNYWFYGLKSGGNNIEYSMALTCMCRQTYDPVFFFSTMIYSHASADIYVYCVPGNKNSSSKYDSEAYDTLLFQYTQTISNTLMTPFLNEAKNDDSVACFDIHGFPTKNIANQETCLLAAEKTDDNQVQVYSGPLLSNVLSNLKKILSAQQFLDKWCYTSVKDTIEKLPGKCTMFMIKDFPLFFCCYAKKSEKLEIQKVLDQKETKDKRLFCAASSEISMQDYRNHYIDSACCAKVTVEYFQKETSAEYFASDSSKSGSSGLCSSTPGKPNNITIVKCCQDGHFCNLKLFPIHSKWDYQQETKCWLKPDISLYFDDSGICEVYYDLVLERQVYLHENISVKIIHETKLPDTKPIAFFTFSCSYAYVEIINFDESDCNDIIGSVKSVYRCTCGDKNCDNIYYVKPEPVKEFSCQYLLFSKIKGSIPSQPIRIEKQKVNWICYIKIIKEFAESHAEVVAGHIDYSNPDNKFKECLKGDVSNSTFCCVNLFNIEKENQENSQCTVQKQIQRFKSSRNDKDPENSSNHDDEEDANKKDKPVPEITHCYSKDIELMDARTESEHCPKSDGCFSTRILQTSEAASETEIEPAGCLGYAEDYTLENLDLTSLSLGCRVKENWGRCSVVQSPSGEKRIVCCCNEPDENGFCNTKLTEVPEKIGKNISSFKEL